MKYRYSILTYNFNNYELLREVQNPQDDVEYIYVTDDPTMTSNTWKIVVDESLSDLSTFEKCYSVRFNPWKYVSTDICVRLDGSVKILDSLDILVNHFNNNNYDLACVIHPFRYNIIDEYNTWITYREYTKEQAQKCINIMANNGFNIAYNKGMIEENFVIQRKTETNQNIDRMVFAFLKYLDSPIERLDQTITSFVLQHYFPDLRIMYMAEQILFSPILRWCIHGSAEEIIQSEHANNDIGYFYNKPHKLIQLKQV